MTWIVKCTRRSEEDSRAGGRKVNKLYQQDWKMSNRVESSASANLYYVFVNMNGGEEPSYYILPSRYVTYRVW